MDELPPEAKAVLGLVKDAHGPSDSQSAARVKARISASLAAPPSIAGASAHKAHGAARIHAIGRSLAGSKLTLASLALAAGVGATLLPSWRSPRPKLAPNSVGDAPAPADLSPATPAAPGTRGSAPKSQSKPAPAPRAVATPKGAASGALLAEMDVLGRASAALTERNVGAGLKLLAEHRRRFPRAQLSEERDGLFALAHCMEQSPGAIQGARRFMERAPGSMLSARIRRACGLDDVP